MHHKIVLENGLRLVTCEMPYAKSASVSVFVGVGSRYEPESLCGVSHFIEHMLFKGTARRPTGKAICECIEGVGGVLNAEASKEMTVYWAKVPHEHLPLAVDVIADLLMNSTFRDEDIDKERRVIAEELSMVMDTPQEWVDVLFDEVLWENQPLGRDIAGTKETVLAMSRADIVGFWQTHYSPANTVVSIVGPYSQECIEDLVRDKLGGWKPSLSRVEAPMGWPTPGPRLRLEYKDTEQTHLCLGVPGPSYLHPDRYVTDLLNVVLGEGMSSRLFQEIRETQALAYDVQSYVHHYRDVGATVVYAGVEPERMMTAIEAILDQLHRLKEPMPEEELAKAKELWKGRLVLRLEDTRSIASWMGSQELLLNYVLSIDELIEIIDQVSSSAVARVASELFRSDQLHLAAVGPLNREAQFTQLLKI